MSQSEKSIVDAFWTEKHDLCFLVTLSKIGEYAELYDYGDELI